MILTFEGALGDGKGKALFKTALQAWNRGFDVIGNEPCRMPNRGGASGWHQCRVLHVDDLMDAGGHALQLFDNTFYAVQDGWSELDARLSGSSKRLLGMVNFLMRFRHYGNWLGADSQRFGDMDIRVRTVTNQRVWCLKGDNKFIEVWLDRVRGDIAVEEADKDVVKLIGQLYFSDSRGVGSHVF